MSNVAIGGFRWIRGDNSGNPPLITGIVATAYGTAIRTGDAVKRVDDGSWAVAAAGDATIENVCAGVVSYYDSAAGSITTGNFLPASVSYSGSADVSNPLASKILVCPTRGQTFEVDCNTAAASVAAAAGYIGNNCDHVATAGAGTSGRSGHVLNTASPGTATAQWRIVEIPDIGGGGNDVTKVNWKAYVTVNETTAPALGTTTGV